MRVWSTLLVLALVFAALSAPAGAVTLTTALKATPATYTGGCPTKVNFTGTIQTHNWVPGEPKVVQYRFERSDGYHGPVHTADFSSGGTSQNIMTSWTLGVPTQQKTGWVAVRTYYPQPAYSNQANFTLTCTGILVTITIIPPPAPPTITVNLHHNATDVNTCPHVAGFTGTITTGAWGAGADRTVNYRFERSDGTLEKIQTLTFPAAGGSQQVVDSWTKGGTGTFWEQLHVVYPTEVSSIKASFSSKCTGM